MRVLLLTIFTVVLLAFPVMADDDNATAPEGTIDNPHIIPKISDPVSIDGIINEAAWQKAQKFELNYEVRPGENIDPPVRTEMYMMYSETHLYVAFRAFDTDPDSIRARYTDRDSAFSDDFVGFVIDTFNDQRRAFEFFCNPYGVQMDMIYDGVNDNEDSSWNAIWDSAGTVDSEGFQVEMAVPFTQIRFQAGDDLQIWGLDAVRSHPRIDRTHIGLVPRDRDINSYLTQFKKIKGFSGVQRGKNLEITPTLTGFKTQERLDFPDGDLEDTDSKMDAGLNIRWGVTPNMTINGTINPDFSQVEADSVQLSINETFALYFQETRPFFLDGADYFDIPLMSLVHTRTIADPTYAIKVTGKEGAHTYGIFTAEDDFTGVVIPGSQGSDSGRFNFQSSTTVGRYRYDIGESSTMGATITNRQGNGYDNTVVALDTRYRFTDQDTLNATFAGSQSTYNTEMVDAFGLTEDDLSDRAFSLSYRHGTRNWWANASYTDYGKDFRADVGFVPQVDYSKVLIGFGREFWGEPGDFFRRVTIQGDWDRTEDKEGNLIEDEYEAYILGIMPRNTFFLFGGGVRDRVFNGVTFDNYWMQSELNSDLTSFIRGGIFARRGQYIDFQHTREADRTLVSTWSEIRIGDHFRFDVRYEYSALDVEDGQRLYTTIVPEIRAVYQFDQRTFFRAILQYVNIERDPDLYADEVDEISKDLMTQLLFSYKINPQTVLYLGYSDSYVGDQDLSMTQTDRTVFMKLGYAWLQ